jgi:hypothetical protein
MKKLYIYRQFAVLHIQTPIYELDLSGYKILDIHCSHNYSLKNNIITVYSKTNDDTNSVELQEISSVVELIIKIGDISWKTHYTIFRNKGQMNCCATIESKNNCLQFDQASLVYRNTDFHPIHSILTLGTKNSLVDTDDATFHYDNLFVYPLSCKELGSHLSVELWKESIDVKEIYEINIMNRDQQYTDNFLVLQAPKDLLPGKVEIYDQTDIVFAIGSLEIKKYNKGDKIMIQFPQTRDIELNSSKIISTQSFFIQKSEIDYTCIIKNPFLRKCISRFYLVNEDFDTSSLIPTSRKKKIVFWDEPLTQEKQKFQLQIKINS